MSEPTKGDYYRHKTTGDLYQVREINDKLLIVRDIPDQQVGFSLAKINEFEKELSPKGLLPGQIARIAFEADSALCRHHMDMPRPNAWLDASEQEKSRWIEGKMKLPESIRLALYIAVTKVLLEYNK